MPMAQPRPCVTASAMCQEVGSDKILTESNYWSCRGAVPPHAKPCRRGYSLNQRPARHGRLLDAALVQLPRELRRRLDLPAAYFTHSSCAGSMKPTVALNIRKPCPIWQVLRQLRIRGTTGAVEQPLPRRNRCLADRLSIIDGDR